jgi:hypothetical protein
MLGGERDPHLYVAAARWPGFGALRTHTDWEGQVLRTSVAVGGAGWPAR